jgi:hypothetical protein
MIVITADQIDSTHNEDLAGDAVATLNARYAADLVLPVDRNAGDEIQAMMVNPESALALTLGLVRTGQWSVGCGIGGVRSPLPDNTREAAGPSFVAAREAVDRAKRAPGRFCLVVASGQPLAEADIAPLIDLLLFVRSRRSAEGWELFDLLSEGMSQKEAALHLGISPQAASQRARAAGIRAELAAIAPLARLLGEADATG